MKVTIVTACYNSKATIANCVKSVQAQDYQDIEHLIIDGASKDSTLEVLESMANAQTRIVSERDDGIYDALNKGIKEASGDVIGFLHADDVFAADTVISQVVAHLNDSTLDACYSDLVYVNPETDSVVRYWRSSKFKKGLFVRGWMPPHPTVYVKKEVYHELGGFNLNLSIGADWDLMVRFFELGGIKTVYHPEVWVRMNLGGTSNRNLMNIAKNNWQTWKQCCDHFGFFPSLFFPPKKWIHRLKQFKQSEHGTVDM